MGFTALSAANTRRIFTRLGEPASFAPQGGDAVQTLAIVERGSEMSAPPVSGYLDAPRVVERRTIVCLLEEDCPVVRRGDTITTASTTFKVDQIDSRDGEVVRAVVQ
ncbi:MAG: head-tail joining protein [Sinimarinibacterium flocculans]|uniref:head-tail joining protein n=1 Tax=Sinimarinibacterium flocculans TaxID=985250 RepID=UPI003C67715C